MQTLPVADPGTPDLRSPMRFLIWVGRAQWRVLVGGIVAGIAQMVSRAVFPAAVGKAIDLGITARDSAALLRWSGVLVLLAAIAAVAGTLRHYMSLHAWLQSSYRCIQLIGHHAADTGQALPRTMPTGEIVATVASDAIRVGSLYEALIRLVGAVVSYVVVAVLLLGYSRPIGLLVLFGVPVLVGSLSVVLRPLQRRQAAQRDEAGKLTTLGADTVAGLRVLRGIGGEHTFLGRYTRQSQQVRRAGVGVAGLQATLDSAQVLLPGVFVVLLTWLGARFAMAGTITAGQLVAFYGYSAFMLTPLRTATEFVDRATRGHIGAGRIIRVLSVRPEVHDPAASGDAALEALPAPGAVLVDPASGVRVEPGRLTAVVSARPAESTALADRLGRFGVEPSEVRLGEVRLDRVALDGVRRRIVVSETDPRMFTGSLREELDPEGTHDDRQLLEVLDVASAADVLEALPDGLDSEVEERGRSFSGGQRQRLALTRALLTDADTLVLVEPTSAVDAHTESRIAARLAAARSPRTTVVMTASPLLLDQADVVYYLDGGRAVARGTHRELMASSPAYRQTVVRGED
jgi:ABC-type multidrug transport system fused ATPase/permease subunit